jgi:predicted NBD/HSP70 family sugar kinase
VAADGGSSRSAISPRESGNRAVTRSILRSGNLSAVARAVAGGPEPISRADVAGTLGVTKSTASRLADELVAGGVLAELPATPTGRGRPSVPLVLSPNLAAVGLQVNTTFLCARVVNLQGAVVSERREEGDFRGSRPRPVLRRLDRLVQNLLAELDQAVEVVGCGLAVPGIVDIEAGLLLTAPNLGWSEVRPADDLDPGVAGGVALLLGNEADMAARAVTETAPGRPSGLRDFIYLSGETGIGGAVVLDGQTMPGRHGWAGEIGHVCVDPDGPPCRCGSTGCLELYAGRQAILTAAGLAADSSPREVVALALGGSTDAEDALARAARSLAVALAGAINILDINVVVLGGHLAQVAEVVGPRLRQQLGSRVLSARWVAPEVAVHGADDSLGATGAAFTQLGQVLDDPAGWFSPIVADPAAGPRRG